MNLFFVICFNTYVAGPKKNNSFWFGPVAQVLSRSRKRYSSLAVFKLGILNLKIARFSCCIWDWCMLIVLCESVLRRAMSIRPPYGRVWKEHRLIKLFFSSSPIVLLIWCSLRVTVRVYAWENVNRCTLPSHDATVDKSSTPYVLRYADIVDFVTWDNFVIKAVSNTMIGIPSLHSSW